MEPKKKLRGQDLIESLGVSWKENVAGDDPATRPISGTYDALGTNPDGNYYGATVDILEDGEIVHVTWWSGEQSSTGKGERDGRLLVVNWHLKHPVIFVIMSDGTLHGTWFNGRAVEKLIPQS